MAREMGLTAENPDQDVDMGGGTMIDNATLFVRSYIRVLGQVSRLDTVLMLPRGPNTWCPTTI